MTNYDSARKRVVATALRVSAGRGLGFKKLTED